jgi:hypothetical protein
MLTLIGGLINPAQAQEPAKHHELTLQGIIGTNSIEKYNEITDLCANRDNGRPGLGPRYISCLNENIQSENKAIDAYLRSWKWPTRPQFQKNNCEIIRSISAREIKEENFLDCVLKGTIEFRMMLRSLIGD